MARPRLRVVVGQTRHVKDPTPTLVLRRSFGWGIVMVEDEQQRGPPAPEDTVVTSSKTGLTVTVHHAQDVAFDGLAPDDPIPGFIVAVDCWRTAAPAGTTVIWEGDLDIPLGRLLIGDAEREDVLELTPGRWHVEVAADPADYPGEVAIWFSK